MMDKKQTLEMIAAISNANGAPGFEDDVVAAILPYARELGETQVDRMRNLFIRRRENTGNRPVVQLDAHSDDVGFMAPCASSPWAAGSATTSPPTRCGCATGRGPISPASPPASPPTS